MINLVSVISFQDKKDLNDIGILLEKRLKCEIVVTELTNDEEFRRLYWPIQKTFVQLKRNFGHQNSGS